MGPHHFIVNCTISPQGLARIDWLRREWDANFIDKADVASAGWGEFHMNDGRRFETVVVSFYSKKQRSQIAPTIQMVSGIEFVFFLLPVHRLHFEGKVLDWEEARGFFLRDP